MRAFLGRPSFNLLLAGVAMLVSFNALANEVPENPGANLANGKKIFNEGKGDTVPACMTCHGAGGWGLDAMGAPRLAGIGFPYVIKQLNDLAAGKRTPDGAGAVMVVFAGGLTEQERRDVAGYVNTLGGPPDLSDLKALKEGDTKNRRKVSWPGHCKIWGYRQGVGLFVLPWLQRPGSGAFVSRHRATEIYLSRQPAERLARRNPNQ